MQIALRVALLSAVLLPLSGAVFQVAGVGGAEPEVIPTPGSLILMAGLETAVLAIATLTATHRGRPLAVALFLAYFGAKSFMSQIESAFFISEMPLDQILRVVAAGFVIAAVFVPGLVWALGRWKADSPRPALRVLTNKPWRWAGVPLAYLSLYFTFGYYVAWSQPELRAFYDGKAPTGFWNHMVGLLSEDPFLIPFQLLRTALWTAFALPLLRRLGGSPLQAGLVLGGVLGVGLTAQLLLANPFMPETVRTIHFAETLPSTLLFGLFLGVLLLEPSPPREPV